MAYIQVDIFLFDKFFYGSVELGSVLRLGGKVFEKVEFEPLERCLLRNEKLKCNDHKLNQNKGETSGRNVGFRDLSKEALLISDLC